MIAKPTPIHQALMQNKAEPRTLDLEFDVWSEVSNAIINVSVLTLHKPRYSP